MEQLGYIRTLFPTFPPSFIIINTTNDQFRCRGVPTLSASSNVVANADALPMLC
jgi:hypothetical protein